MVLEKESKYLMVAVTAHCIASARDVLFGFAMFEDDYQQPNEDAPSSFNWRNVLFTLVEHWQWILLCLLVSATLTVIYLQRAPVIYAATAVLKFETEKPKILNIEEVVDENYHDEELVSEKLGEVDQLLKNRDILQRVVTANHLASDPRFLPTAQSSNAVDEAWLVSQLSQQVQAKPRKGTHLVDVTVENGDPALCAQLANSLVDEFIRHNAESYKTESLQATAFLADEARDLQRKLNNAEAQMQEYRDQSLSLEQRQAIVADNLKNLNEKVESAKADRLRLETDYKPVQRLDNDVENLLQLPTIATDPSVVAARAAIGGQEVDFANLKHMYREKHPVYIQARSKLEELYRVLSNTTLRVAQVMRTTYENALARESTLREELSKQETEAQDLNKQFVPYNVLLRDIEQYRSLYDAVVKRIGETTIASNIEDQRIQVFERAEVPKWPSKPKKLEVVVLGLLGGLGLSIAVTLGVGLMDDSFKTLTETEQALKMPVLTTIPEIPSVRADERRIVVDDNGPTSGSESFRFLRTSLSLQDGEKPLRTFLFTSVVPGEGKTFCAVNYAASLARQGLKTVVIDCDLRRPMVDEFLWEVKTDRWGLAQMISHNLEMDDVVRGTAIENLWIIPAGPYVVKSSELLARCPFNLILEDALRRFDRVVVDSAPIFGVSDTLLLVRHTDAVCLVVWAWHTSRASVMRAVQLLERSGAPATGIILNALPRNRRTGYRDPYYDYGYYPKKSPAPAEKQETV
jgi:capsular exopolysaccharide synthesis family protein